MDRSQTHGRDRGSAVLRVVGVRSQQRHRVFPRISHPLVGLQSINPANEVAAALQRRRTVLLPTCDPFLEIVICSRSRHLNESCGLRVERTVAVLNLAKDCVLDRVAQRYQRIRHEQRHLLRNRSDARDHGLAIGDDWHLLELEDPVSLALVFVEKIGCLGNDFVSVRQGRSDSQVMVGKPVISQIQ